MSKTQSAGNRGEAAVARYLRQKGYTPQAAAAPQCRRAVSGGERAGRTGPVRRGGGL